MRQKNCTLSRILYSKIHAQNYFTQCFHLLSPVSQLLSHIFCLMSPLTFPVSVSVLMSPVSQFLSHCLLSIVSILTSHLLSHVSSLMSPISHLLSPVSHLLSPDSVLLSHVKCLLSLNSCLLPPVSRLLSPVSHLLQYLMLVHRQ